MRMMMTLEKHEKRQAREQINHQPIEPILPNMSRSKDETVSRLVHVHKQECAQPAAHNDHVEVFGDQALKIAYASGHNKAVDEAY